ncbi:MAG: hypothetical protein IKP47_11615 [Ruminococcus sp.]|nr:hypothetical protein [Ruminococcus sp.]
MKKTVSLLLERLAIILIVGATSFALFFSIGSDTDIAVKISLDAAFGTILLLMLIAFVKNVSKYIRTGDFFGACKPTASLGLAAYVISRMAWSSFLTALIFINHFSSDRYQAASVAMLVIWLFAGFIAVPMGIMFFGKRSAERRSGGFVPESFRQAFGSGEGTHLKLICDIFDRYDASTNRRIDIASHGRVPVCTGGSVPSLMLLQMGMAAQVHTVTAGSLEELAEQTEPVYLRAINGMLYNLGYGVMISPSDWRAVILSGADQWVLNRLSGGVDVRYYILSCAESLLFPFGLSVAELICRGEMSIALIAETAKLRELEAITR